MPGTQPSPFEKVARVRMAEMTMPRQPRTLRPGRAGEAALEPAALSVLS